MTEKKQEFNPILYSSIARVIVDAKIKCLQKYQYHIAENVLGNWKTCFTG